MYSFFFTGFIITVNSAKLVHAVIGPRSRRRYRKDTCSGLGTCAEWTAPGFCINYSGTDNHQRGRYTAVHRRGPGWSKLKTTLKGVVSHSWTPRAYPPIAPHGNKVWKMLEDRRHLQQRMSYEDTFGTTAAKDQEEVVVYLVWLL